MPKFVQLGLTWKQESNISASTTFNIPEDFKQTKAKQTMYAEKKARHFAKVWKVDPNFSCHINSLQLFRIIWLKYL